MLFLARMLALLLLLPIVSSAAEVAPLPRLVSPTPAAKMPFANLAPATVVPDLCLYHYRVSTNSSECQTFCDQGFGYYYSYVWMEAARCFETALQYDPDCAIAWLGLYRSMEKWGRGATPLSNPGMALLSGLVQPKLPERLTLSPRDYCLQRAKELMTKANHQEQLLIKAKLQEKGMWPGVGPDARRKAAQATLDELLTLHDDDEEGWFARAQLGDGQHGGAPFYKALLKINPLHPGANHEFVHFYENIRRPALGWPYAEGYIASSPGLPHAFHMQAHLGMRIGKWKQTTDFSTRAIELQREYHRRDSVKPDEDHQFAHHLETLTRSLVHDGRFTEAEAIKKEAIGYKYNFRPEWFRMALAQQKWADAEEIVAFFRKQDKFNGAYYSALLALEQRDTAKAVGAVQVMAQTLQSKKGNRQNELRYWEVQGRLLGQQGQGEAASKLLKRAVDKTKDDYYHHSWGGGATYMEAWGIASLEGGALADAEEAFQEALAHDAGSVRGALGMWAICQKLGRGEEAERYMRLAQRCWAKADTRDFGRLQQSFKRMAEGRSSSQTIAAK
jgi:tetratricopeptide (TPR) repeat protein